MRLSILLLGVLLILLGCSWLAFFSVSIKLLGVIALVDGILFIIEEFHPIVVRK